MKRRRVYRPIFEKFFGPIPHEADGTPYDVHHKNGDHSDNSPNNLEAITHSRHAAIHALERSNRGTHPMSSEVSKKLTKSRMDAGTHNAIIPGTCPHCGKVGKKLSISWHASRCKLNPDRG